MAIIVCEMDATNLQDLNRVDGTYIIDSRLVLPVDDGEISYTIEPMAPYSKSYGVDEIDCSMYIANPAKVVFLAYVDGQIAGHIIVSKNWNHYTGTESLERMSDEIATGDKGGMMIIGKRVSLRPIREDDWSLFERWGESREALWGPYQRYQPDHLPKLRQAFHAGGLLTRENGFLLIETLAEKQAIGFVRYTLLQFPDADISYPEIGYGITEAAARGKGYATEAAALLVDYLLAGYPTERIAAFTDVDNLPSQKVLERLGFRREGVLRRASFRDHQWRDIALYGLLREEWKGVEGVG